MTGLGPLRSHFQLAARRGLTKFVGREREMEQMQRRSNGMRRSRADRRSDGGSGTGKSRLFYEFKAVSSPAGWCLSLFRLARQGVGVAAGVELLQSISKSRPKTTPATRREKVPADSRLLTHRERCRICSVCSALSRATIRSPRWTARSRSGARWKRSSRYLREIAESAANGDLRGSALDRRADPGILEPPGRFDRDREDFAAC